jgi:hypothetical protein
MKAEEWKPQISQMNADVFLNALICAHLHHLRFNHPEKSLRENLEKIEV